MIDEGSVSAGTQTALSLTRRQYTRRQYQRFARIGLGLVGSGLLALGCLNVVVDPFRAFRLVDLPSLRNRRQPIGETRTGKAELLMRSAAHTVLLGTSRTDIGIDPGLPNWGTREVVNLGLGGETISESADIFRASLRLPTVRRVVLFADFPAFNSKRAASGDFVRSLFNPRTERLNYALSNLFSRFAMDNSTQVLKRWSSGSPATYDERGFRAGHRPTTRSYRTLFRQTVWSALRNPDGFLNYLYGPESTQFVRRMYEESRERGVSLIVVIPPLHALGLETIRAAGLWPLFCQWKRDLLLAVSADLDGRAVPVWDFAEYSTFAEEPIPEDGPGGESVHPMRWFWESSHFTRELGRLVVYRITGSTAPGSFGARLELATLDARLREIDTARESYARANPEEVQFVAEITARARKR